MPGRKCYKCDGPEAAICDKCDRPICNNHRNCKGITTDVNYQCTTIDYCRPACGEIYNPRHPRRERE